jgi:hypothetical protein
MFIAVDFDGTVVEQHGRAYDDVTTPLRLLPGARDGLQALKRAGHVLSLWSGRASPALLDDPMLDSLMRAGVRRISSTTWPEQQRINRARHKQMLDFVRRELPGVFDAIDDGRSGKPSVDLFIDDKCLRYGASNSWRQIAASLGAAERK